MNDKPTLKVGIEGLKNPTPKPLTYLFRGYTFLAGIWAILSPAITNMPPETLAEINKWVLIGVPVMQFTIKFFGLDFSENRY